MAEFRVLTTLKRHTPKKGVYEYKRFIEIDGYLYRQDWEVSTTADLAEEFLIDLMDKDVEFDVANGLPDSNTTYDPETYDDKVGRWVEAGFDVV